MYNKELKPGHAYYAIIRYTKKFTRNTKKFTRSGMNYFFVLKKEYVYEQCWYTIYSFVTKKIHVIPLTPESYLCLEQNEL